MDTMTTRTVTERPRLTSHATEPLESSPASLPLADVLASIRADSRVQPKQYLDQIVVPFGGE